MLKNLLKLALVALCALPAMTSCSGDDEPKAPEDNLPAETKKLVGVWGYYSDGYHGLERTLELFANGKCILNGTKGEWSYNRETKMLSTSVGVQATITLSTDNAWTGYAPSGTEYNCKRRDLIAYFQYERQNNLLQAWVTAMLADSGLTKEDIDFGQDGMDSCLADAAATWALVIQKEAGSQSAAEELLKKIAKEQCAPEIYNSAGFGVDLSLRHFGDANYSLGGGVSSGYTLYGHYYRDLDGYYQSGRETFKIADSSVEVSQTAGGYKAKITMQIPESGEKIYEVEINPFEESK